MYKFFSSIVILLALCTITCSAKQKEVEATISLSELFKPNVDLDYGIKGSVEEGGKISVKVLDKKYRTIIFCMETSLTTSTFAAIGINYTSKADIGIASTYYPRYWNSLDIKTAVGSLDRFYYDHSTTRPYPFLQGNLDLIIQINEDKAQIEQCKLPVIGIIDRFGGNPLFPPNHFCHDLKNLQSFTTRTWSKMKSPDISKSIDLSLAAHRGIWGDNLGNSNPENSIEAIRRTKGYTDILESDIMITKDKQLIVSHDYNMHRLSDYSGPETDYLFRLNSDVLANLYLRQRNMEVSNYKYLRFADLIDALIQYELVLTIDIKEIIARNKNGVCIDNCEYDPKTYGDLARQKVKDSWMEIFRGCIKIAAEKNALQYIAFKTPHTYEELSKYVSVDTLNQVLFMPVIQPGRKDYLEFADSWINSGCDKVIAFETNFKKDSDRALQPISRNGESYVNFLHYIYARTGLRPGCYPEEPMGPKGIVNRWADWLIKDLTQDYRGDHYWMLSIPYAKIMVLTVDRPDIWQRMTEIYNNISK